jgi:hypothetical protein
MNFFPDRPVSEAAAERIRFDADSIRQVASGRRQASPDVWLADPDAYEKNGRIQRDSESLRMLAYDAEGLILYATDGCNSCMRRVPAKLEVLPANALKQFAEENNIRIELLEQLARIVRGG